MITDQNVIEELFRNDLPNIPVKKFNDKKFFMKWLKQHDCINNMYSLGTLGRVYCEALGVNIMDMIGAGSK